MSSLRTQWLDIAKALAIILMVIGHTSIPHFASDFIYAFHMPIFFLASGWSTNWSKYSFGVFTKRRVKSLLIPYIIYSSIVVAISYLIDSSQIFSIAKGWQGYALWFIVVLFIASIMSKIIVDINNSVVQILAAIVCLICGALLSYFRVVLPWTLSTVPYAIFLILAGTYLRKYESYISNPRFQVFIICFFLVATISHFHRLDLAWNKILPVIPLTIGAISGAAMVATISSYISNKVKWLSSLLTNIGKETYVIMAFSQLIIIILNKYFDLNPIYKYLSLVAILVVLVYSKNLIVSLFRKLN